MKTITFFANMPTFAAPIAQHFQKKDDWVVKFFINGNEDQFRTCLQTSDVLWFEWCNELLLYSQQMTSLKGGKVICRLHSYEAFTDMPKQVDWSRVDHLIFVNPAVKELLEALGVQVAPNVTQSIIPNLVEYEKYSFFDVREKKNKIASLGHLNYKKDSSMLLPISEALSSSFPKHKIHVAGEFQDIRYKLLFDRYFKNVDSSQNIVFDGYQKNVAGWLEDKKYVLNTSLFESFNYGVAEGILCGAIPLVRNWLGSEVVWPEATRWDTLNDLMKAIKKFEELDQASFISQQKKNRDFVIDTYGFDKIIPQIERIVES